jgi:hypothetical protein
MHSTQEAELYFRLPCDLMASLESLLLGVYIKALLLEVYIKAFNVHDYIASVDQNE